MLKKFFNLFKAEIRILRALVYHRVYTTARVEKSVVEEFHKLYYYSHLFGKTWENTFWQGVPTYKCPLDLWIYQEIIFEVKPDIIIETGTAYGGSALFLASILDLLNLGKVLTIDIKKEKNRPKHQRIIYLQGSSTSQQISQKIKSWISQGDKVMVFLDSDHHKNHVLKELKLYSQLVSKGSYLIVEDTNLNGHPIKSYTGPGPFEAVEEFLQENLDFVVDETKEKFYLTFNPRGYLRKIK